MKVGEMPTGHFDKLASFVGNSRQKAGQKDAKIAGGVN